MLLTIISILYRFVLSHGGFSPPKPLGVFRYYTIYADTLREIAGTTSLKIHNRRRKVFPE